MDKDKTRENVKTVVMYVLTEKNGIDQASVSDDSHLINDLGFDSLDCVELIMYTEQELGISIPDEKAETMLTTVRALVDGITDIISPDLPTPSEAVVQLVVAFLIEKNGSTSTKEVKEFLRSNGYWCKQNDISEVMGRMQSILSPIELKRENNGRYNVWTKQSDASVIDTNQAMDFITDTSSTPLATVSKNDGIRILSNDISGISVTSIDLLYPEDSWVVFDKDFTKKIMVYDSNESRDSVRSHYSKNTDTAFHDVRSRRIKNYLNARAAAFNI